MATPEPALGAQNALNENPEVRLQLGDIGFNIPRLIQQLRTDLKDDWFPDPFRFSDLLEPGIVRKRLLDNFETNHGRYVPSKRTIFNIPKPNLTLRCSLETSLSDRAIYHGLVAFLVPFYDPLIPWNVFNHRPDRLRPNDRYMFKRGIPAWKDFLGAVRSALHDGPGWLLSTDIKDFYEHIDLAALECTAIDLIPRVHATAKQKSQIRAYINILFSCLKSWSFRPDRGLPQTRDASSFLANLYMYPVDIAMCQGGYSDVYFRYMDDIKVICRDEFAARRALKDLCLALRGRGLSVNSKKTLLCSSTSADIAKCCDESPPVVEHIDAMWHSRSREVIQRSLPILRQLTLSLIAENRVDTRDFRFCVNKLSSLASCSDFWVQETFFSDITPAVLGGLSRFPAATKEFSEYLLAAPTSDRDLREVGKYLCDRHRCIYNWQNYYLWLLLTQKSFTDVNLLSEARRIITTEEDNATRAGATLYLGALGDSQARTQIAETFSSTTSFLGQRCALIAVHDLPYPVIREQVQPHIRTELIGVYRELRKHRGVYCTPIERTPIASFVDSEREYD